MFTKLLAKISADVALRASISFMLTCFMGQAIHAATDSTTMNVTATVQATCVFDSIVDSGFGNISGLFTADADISSGSISVQCTNLAGYSIGIDNGSNFLVNRRMAFSGNFINYELYQDSGYTQVWGDISSGNEKLLQVGDGAVQAHTVYARIPSGQSPAGAGSYSDQVTVTVNF